MTLTGDTPPQVLHDTQAAHRLRAESRSPMPAMSADSVGPATSPCEICWAEVAIHLSAFHRDWHRAQVDGHATLEERAIRRATTAATDIVRARMAASSGTAGPSA